VVRGIRGVFFSLQSRVLPREKGEIMTVTLEDIKRIVSLQLGIREVGDEDRFMEELGAESLDVMNIIIAVEEKFSVAIKDSEIPKLKTPAVLFAFVKERS